MSETTDQNPFTTAKFIRSCMVLAVVAAMGVFLTIHALWQDSRPGPDTTVAACERPATDEEPVGAIPVQSWDYTGIAKTPNTAYGPHDHAEAPYCFEHSPTGAAVAAATVASLGVNGQSTTALRHMALDTASRAAALEVPDPRQDFTSTLPPVAVRVADYEGDAADIIVVIDTHQGYVAGTYRMVWDDGDWKWEVPRDDPRGTNVVNIAGFNRLVDQEADRG